MRVPVNWLNEYVAPDLTTAQVADRLAMTGTEVERIEHHGVAALEHFVVGRVLEAGRHPDADRLSLCRVDVGDGHPQQIVCGAPNVAAGQTVAVATPGAVMPDGTTLGKARLRGVDSNGMILAEDELAIGTEHAGIMVLAENGDDRAPSPGTPLATVLPIATDVLVLEVTPNRPDCLGIYGVAREVHAATGARLSAPPWAADTGSEGPLDGISIEVLTDNCPRFTARIFEDVKIGPSPPWLKARLMASGQRPISNVVDITNYVMLLTGQPMHAFDLDRIAGARLTVRQARAGETLETLDGQTRALDERMVLIEDADGPTSIAGVMGGERSEVYDETTRVLMEAATWNGANIHRTSLELGLRTEASTRFEKQLQPEVTLEAQAVATQLMVELCGASVRSGTTDIGGPGPEPPLIRLRDARLSGLLGLPVAREQSRRILEALEFVVADADDGLDVRPPAFRRADVTREADVIEEVARLDGLEKLPATLPSRHGASGRLTAVQRLRRGAADALVAQGLHEVVGWSFEGPEMARRLRLGERPAVELANPMSSDQSRMRTMVIGSLLTVAQRNWAHGAGAIRLFEAGAVYLPANGRRLPREPYHIAALITGPVRPPTWLDPAPRDADLFAIKGVLAGLLDTLPAPWTLAAGTPPAPAAHPPGQLSQEDGPLPFLHPARAAAITVGGEAVGWLGEIHPRVAADWGLAGLAAFEIDLDAIAPHVTETALYVDVTSFPSVREDLAVVVGEARTAAEVLDVVRRAGAPLLCDARVFDVYRDPARLGEGNRSLALRLEYRSPDRTLTDEEVAAKRAAITAALESELQGRVRAA
jgi:phenylalanyl-tRNA synthetase beta chain